MSRPLIVVNISDPELGGILKRYGSDTKAATRIFCRFDGGLFDYLFVEETGDEEGDQYRPLDLTGYLIETALGNIDLAPTDGTFRLTYDGSPTVDLNWNATAQEVNDALEAIGSIGLGSVDVIKYGSAYEVRFTNTGARSLLVGESTLTPTSTAYVARVQEGDVDTKEIQWVRLIQSPLSYTASFTPSTLGGVTVSTLQAGSATQKEVQRIALSTPATSGTFIVNMLTTQEFTIICLPNTSHAIQNKGFLCADANGTVGTALFETTGTAPAEVTAATRQLNVTTIVNGDSATTVATKIAAVYEADAQFTATSSGNVVTVRQVSGGVRIRPTDIDTGFTFTTTADGALVSAPVPLRATGNIVSAALGGAVSVVESGNNQWDIAWPVTGNQDPITVAAQPLFPYIYSANLSINTPGIFERFAITGDGEPIEVKWEISLKAPGQEPTTVYQQDHNIIADVITDGVSSPQSMGVGLNQLTGLNVLNGVTGYTGGGSSNLDGVTTIGVSVPYWVIFNHATAGGRIFRLDAGTDAEASPGVIRPDDYNASTNAKVWKSVL